MTLEPYAVIDEEIIYPESDGLPMADSTEQFDWIVMVKENLEALYEDVPSVFVAGNLFWYPVEGSPDIRRAPDAMVAFGRPKGKRRSYLQWREGGIAPQVVFEIWSHSNIRSEMEEKHQFYQEHGAEEYYEYDPERNQLRGWQRVGGYLVPIPQMDGWVSPWLRIRFAEGEPEPTLYYPDGEPFWTLAALRKDRNQERQGRQQAEQRADQAEQERDAERQGRQQAETRASQAETRAEQLAAQLRALGIDPDAMG